MDSRNPQLSDEELKRADYVFYRIFDVGSCTISDQIGDLVGGLDGMLFYMLNFIFFAPVVEASLRCGGILNVAVTTMIL